MKKTLWVLGTIFLATASVSSVAASATGRHVAYSCERRYLQDGQSLGYFSRGRMEEGKSIEIAAGSVKGSLKLTTVGDKFVVEATQTEPSEENFKVELTPDFPTTRFAFEYSMWRWDDPCFVACSFELKKDE